MMKILSFIPNVIRLLEVLSNRVTWSDFCFKSITLVAHVEGIELGKEEVRKMEVRYQLKTC